MSSKLQNTGYLLVDHRESPGIPDEVLAQARKDGLQVISAPKGQLVEMDAWSCSHCQAIVIKNPLRTRERSWCSKCDKYICDRCGAVMAATGECKPFKQLVAETIDAVIASEAPSWVPNLVGLDQTQGPKVLTG